MEMEIHWAIVIVFSSLLALLSFSLAFFGVKNSEAVNSLKFVGRTFKKVAGKKKVLKQLRAEMQSQEYIDLLEWYARDGFADIALVAFCLAHKLRKESNYLMRFFNDIHNYQGRGECYLLRLYLSLFSHINDIFAC